MNENEVKIPANTEDPSENIPESGSKYDYSTVFDCNASTEPSKEEFSSREYLKGIYKNGEELDSSLNKDVRYTRSQYLNDFETIENNYNGDIRLQKKSIAVTVCGGVMLLVLGTLFFKLAKAAQCGQHILFCGLRDISQLLLHLLLPYF